MWALSRFDQKSLYNEKPTVTEIISGPPAFHGFLEANDGSTGLDPEAACIVIMERASL